MLFKSQEVSREAREMNRYLLLLIVIAFLSAPVLAMVIEEPKDLGDGKITIGPTIGPRETISVSYMSKVSIIDRIITTFSDILGFTQEAVTDVQDDVMVDIDGKTIAIIPADCKFNGLTIHEECLVWQYGTDLWYDCEVGLQ
jgi:hypothetical protein